MSRTLTVLGALLVLVWLFFGLRLESFINRVDPVTLPTIGPRAEAIHSTSFVADLHADSLLFDRDLRARFVGDRRAVLNESGLSPAARSRFQALDAAGLALDAELRERYLMSALCRGFPLTCAALGSLPEGDAALARFLAAPAVFAPLGVLAGSGDDAGFPDRHGVGRAARDPQQDLPYP